MSRRPRAKEPGPWPTGLIAVVHICIISDSLNHPQICHGCFHFYLTGEETKDQEVGRACSLQNIVLHREREVILDAVSLTTHPLVCSLISFTPLFRFHSLGEGFSDHHF